MDSEDEITFDFFPYLRVHKSGRVERLIKDREFVPASVDPATGVASKDVQIAPETGVSARLYLPSLAAASTKRMPLLVYYHGGGFCICNPFMPGYHNYLNSLVARANVVAVSVDYRLAPEYPIPAAYDDSWRSLQWVAAHAKGGPGAEEAWLADHADFDRVFIAGESAGGNIAHHMAMRAGADGLPHGVRVEGIVPIHPYFLGSDPVESAAMNPEFMGVAESMWELACPTAAGGVDNPWINPMAEGAPSLAGLGCRRALVCVAGEDVMRDRERAYCHELRESGWGGEVELYETVGKGHAFHLLDTACDEALAQDKAICRFLNQQ